MKKLSVTSHGVRIRHTPCFAGIAVAFGLFCLYPLGPARAQQADDMTQTLLSGLQARENSVKSGTGYLIRESYTNPDPDILATSPDDISRRDQAAPPGLMQWYWYAQGQKIREDERIIAPSKSYEFKSFDGTKSQLLNVLGTGDNPVAQELDGAVRIVIGAGPREAQLNLGKEPTLISQTIKEKGGSYAGMENINGVKTIKVTGQVSQPGNVRENWWFAPDLQMLLVKNERTADATADEPAVKRYRTLTLVDKAVKVNGIWVPWTERKIQFVQFKDSQKVSWSWMLRFEIQSIQLNQDSFYNPFELPLAMGTRVMGGVASGDARIKSHFYVVGGETLNFERRIARGKPDPEELSELPSIETVDNGDQNGNN